MGLLGDMSESCILGFHGDNLRAEASSYLVNVGSLRCEICWHALTRLEEQQSKVIGGCL